MLIEGQKEIEENLNWRIWSIVHLEEKGIV